MDVTIRELALRDFTAVIGLIKNEMGCCDISSDIYDRILRMYEHDDYFTLVAELEGRIIGFIGIMRGMTFELEGDYFRIIALAVKQEYQDMHVGLMLVEKAEEYAGKTGASSVVLSSGLNCPDIHAFYKKVGYVRKGYTYVKAIEAEKNKEREDLLKPIPKRHF